MNTETKQLLERAAKAAGYEVEWDGYQFWVQWPEYSSPSIWSPLESDADAFRLMVDCLIIPNYHMGFVSAKPQGLRAVHDGWYAQESDHNNDKRAATRMAIVRAAAGEV